MNRIISALLLLLANLGNGLAATNEARITDVAFTAACDGTEQRYVLMLPAGFKADQPHDLLIALHGHGSDRWQFVRDPRDECRAARDVAAAHNLIYVSPDYRAKTSWMGPKAEADLAQIIAELKRQYRIQRVFLCGGSMGGSSSLTFAALHPDLVYGVAAMNGTANHVEFANFQDAIAASFGGTKTEIPDDFKKRSAEFWPERFTMPVGLTVGGKDDIVPPPNVVRLADKLKAGGRDVLLIHRAEGGHSTNYDDAKTILEFVIQKAGKRGLSPSPAQAPISAAPATSIPSPVAVVQAAGAVSTYEVVLDGTLCATFALPELAGQGRPKIEIKAVEDGWQHVTLRWDVTAATQQDELSIPFDLGFEPDFWWAPHLAPREGFVVAQHVFRAPALIVQHGSLTFVLVPDLDRVGRREANPWFLDYDAPRRKLWLGMVKTKTPEHVLFQKTGGMTFAPGPIELSFYVLAFHDRGEVRNPWARTTEFFWKRWARPLQEQGEPISAPLDAYVRRTYDWAFQGWGDSVWQEFDLDGRRVGAPQFIVNISQSPNHPGPWYQREFRSIWNQAWFSSLRSASGLYRYAHDRQDAELLRKAGLTKELALAAPLRDGIFPAVIGTGNEDVTIDGKKLRRPKGWSEARWSNSDRTPREHGITPEWYHVLDSSWTALLMLRWHAELEPDARLLAYARTYGDRLLSLQDPAGFFPGWLHPETHQPGPVMNRTTESSLSVTFLLKLAALTGEPRYREAAVRAMDALLAGPVPNGQWLDFENFWSCSPWGKTEFLDRKIARNAMHKQNTLSSFWTAEALLEVYRATHEPRYLAWGRRTLDELSMSQQVWQPPFIHVPALGGFGVMNGDGEWNDSRQSLFAELFLDYYRETGNPAYFERGVAALQAGFIMMYCPENPRVKAMWEKVYPWFGPADYGFMMENYGHGGHTSAAGEGMGVFTIYDWGNGAAAEAATRILAHYGHVFVDRGRRQAFGLDNIGAEWTAAGVRLNDRVTPAAPRTVRIVFDDGTSREVRLDGTLTVPVTTP